MEKYQLKIWTKDEAGNRSENSFHTVCFLDTKKPEILIRSQNEFQKVRRYQKVKIRIKDENLQKNAVKVITSGKQMKGFVQKGEYYESEVVFDRNGKHNLLVQVEDMAGNAVDQ